MLECPLLPCTGAEKDGGGSTAHSLQARLRMAVGQLGTPLRSQRGRLSGHCTAAPVAEGAALLWPQSSSVVFCPFQLLLDPDTQARTDLLL